MSDQSPTTERSQLELFTKHFPNAVYMPSKKEDIHSTTNKELSAQQAIMRQKNTDNPNMKFKEANALGETHFLLVLDFDDHDKTGTNDIKGFLKEFTLKPTLKVKTPTGAGYQLYYKIPADAEVMARSYKFPYNVEAFVGLSNSNSVRVVPGSTKEEGEYTIEVDKPIASISPKLLSAMKVQTETKFKEITQRKTQFTHFEGQVDGQANIIDGRKYVRKIVDDIEDSGKDPFTKGKRNNRIFSVACDLATRYLSAEKIFELIHKNIILDEVAWPDGDFTEEELMITVKSAISHVEESNRGTERATHLDPFKRTEYGMLEISLAEYREKVEYTLKYEMSHVLSDETLRNTLFECIIFDEGYYYVPVKMSKDRYTAAYRQSIQEEKMDISTYIDWDLLEAKTETGLHWKRLTPPQVNEELKFPSRGGKLQSPTQHVDFHSRIIRAKVKMVQTSKDGYICKSGYFYAVPEHAIQPLKNITKAERKEALELIGVILRNVVDPDNAENEVNHFLDRTSLIYNNPIRRTENVIIMVGQQGTGKTAIHRIMMALFPKNYTNILYHVDDLDNRFTETPPYTHVDDTNLNDLPPAALAKVKGLVTADQVPIEKKGKDRVFTGMALNLSINTNHEITNSDVLEERRFTIFQCDRYSHPDKMAKEIAAVFKILKDNDWYLLRVIATILRDRNTSNFNPKYKTPTQLHSIMRNNSNTKIERVLLFMIKNYGYITPDIQLFKEGECINRHDIFAAYEHATNVIDGVETNVENYRHVSGRKIPSLFDFEGAMKKKMARALYSGVFKDAELTVKSGVNDHIPSTWSNRIPSMKNQIKLLSSFMTGTMGNEKEIIRKFNIKEQWEWDGTKPELPNLGSINPYDGVELYEDDDEDESW